MHTHEEPLAGLNTGLHCNCTCYMFKKTYLVFCESWRYLQYL